MVHLDALWSELGCKGASPCQCPGRSPEQDSSIQQNGRLYMLIIHLLFRL